MWEIKIIAATGWIGGKYSICSHIRRKRGDNICIVRLTEAFFEFSDGSSCVSAAFLVHSELCVQRPVCISHSLQELMLVNRIFLVLGHHLPCYAPGEVMP